MIGKLKDHYDVGIYGWWGHDNFGGCLTYFALNKVIEKMGYSVVMLQEANGLPVRYTIPEDCIAMQFITKNCDCTKQVNVLDLQQYNDLCDTFIVGGDQMWSFYIQMVREDNFLSFVDSNKIKLSYSTSFGPANFNPPKQFVDMAKPLLKEFDAISVREDYAVKLASEIYNVKAEQVIDAVFLLEKSDFVKVSADASYDFPKKFLFAFILNPTKDKRRQVECIANKLGLDIVCAPDAAVGYHKIFFEIFSGLKVINPLNVSNFLKAYEKASYIVTDSFHGTCFSYIYKKNFSVYFNYQRGADRFVALMKILELNNRRIYENQSDEDLTKNTDIDFNVDWSSAENNIASERTKSWNWLFNALSLAKDKKKEKRNYLTIDVLPKNLCTGCSACFNGCPVDAISMIENEQGFYEPSIDYEKCIKCGKCERICPVLHPNRKNGRNPECYAVMNNDEIRKDSSSGGVFSALAEYVLNKGGYVCGAGYGDDFVVEHKIVSDEEGVKSLRRSKYVMSKVGDCYRRIKGLLNDNKYVLFTGCPCQVGGLKNYLGKEYDNLILADIVCHGAPSNKMFQKYLSETYGIENVKDFKFRTKEYGYNCTTAKVAKEDGSYEVREYTFDLYERVMHTGIALKDSCVDCLFAAVPRQGDITMGDFWGISKFNPKLNDGLGTSVLLINNTHGEKILSRIKNKLKKVVIVPFEYARTNNRFSNKVGTPSGRPLFLSMINNQSFEKSALYAMRQRYNIGLVGLWYSWNYGDILSYYAMYYVLTKKLGQTVLVVENCLRPENNIDRSKMSPRGFAESYYQLSEKYSPDDLYLLNNKCDMYVVAADQLWNINISRPYKYTYFLGFAEKKNRKVSYATSFGKEYSGTKQEKIIAEYYLKQFNNISVGDTLSKRIAKKDFGLSNVTYVCDPAFLCPIDEYQRLADKSGIKLSGEFIFVYLTTQNSDVGNMLSQISRKFRCKVYVVIDFQSNRIDEIIKESNIHEDSFIEVKRYVDVHEWLWFCKNSSAIITDSYYGVIYSLIFSKPFLAKASQSIGVDRFLSLLEPLGLSNTLCGEYGDIIAKSDMLDQFDYSSINKKIKSICKHSFDWLKTEVEE